VDDCYAGYAPCITDSYPHRVTSTKCRIDVVISPDDGNIVARNMSRKEINILSKNLCSKLALFTRLYRDARSTKHKILMENYGGLIISVLVITLGQFWTGSDHVLDYV